MMPIETLKRNQTKLFLLLLSFMAAVIFLMGTLLLNKDKPKERKMKSYKSPIVSASSQVDPKEIWVERLSSDMNLNQKRIDNLEKGVETLIKTFESSTSQDQKVVPQTQNQTQVLASSSTQTLPDVGGLRQDMKQSTKDDFIEKGNVDSSPIQNTNITTESYQKKETQQKRVHTKGIQRTNLSLIHTRGQKPLKTFDNTIPAGTFAKAVLLGGVDASTSIQASNDPRPILLRLTDHGNLPRKFRSDICDCHVLAATYGDISSERVYMRLEKLTCVERMSGEVLEMNVTGYVAGEDGRAGLRGIIVDRAGESVRAAAVGGFIGGMANFLAQSNNNPVTYSLQSGLSQNNPLSSADILKQGASKGATTAMEKYADFYIKRAEQMQPVISVEAGRVGDIVFTQGVSFEDSAARSALVRSSDQTRYQQIQESHSETKPVEAWIPKKEG